MRINKLHNRKAKQRLTKKEKVNNGVCDKTNKIIREIFCNEAKERIVDKNEEEQNLMDKAKEIKERFWYCMNKKKECIVDEKKDNEQQEMRECYGNKDLWVDANDAKKNKKKETLVCDK